MRKTLKLPARILICAAMAGSASAAAIALPGGIASASPLAVTCTHLTGSSTAQTISGCTGTGANTANAGTPPAHGKTTSNLSTKKATVTWSNGKKTVSTFTYTSVTNNCPAVTGKSKVTKVHETGKVIASGTTTLGMVGHATSAYICVYKSSTGALSVTNMGNVII